MHYQRTPHTPSLTHLLTAISQLAANLPPQPHTLTLQKVVTARSVLQSAPYSDRASECDLVQEHTATGLQSFDSGELAARLASDGTLPFFVRVRRRTVAAPRTPPAMAHPTAMPATAPPERLSSEPSSEILSSGLLRDLAEAASAQPASVALTCQFVPPRLPLRRRARANARRWPSRSSSERLGQPHFWSPMPPAVLAVTAEGGQLRCACGSFGQRVLHAGGSASPGWSPPGWCFGRRARAQRRGRGEQRGQAESCNEVCSDIVREVCNHSHLQRSPPAQPEASATRSVVDRGLVPFSEWEG